MPAAPRYSVGWSTPVTTIVSDYFGIQALDLGSPEQHAFFERARASFAGPDGPDSFEIMRCTDEAGLTNAVVVAYWLDAVKHARWEAASQFVSWFRHDDRLVGPVGAWRETNAVPYDRHETIFSEPSYKVAVGLTKGACLVPITTHGYFGSARDRIPISAVDPLESPYSDKAPTARPCAGFGQRLQVAAPVNMVSLRSGQYWARAEGEQLDDYVNEMRPRLMAGMKYLLEHKQETGTLSLRIMTNLDDDGAERRETSVYAQFLSLSPLEQWAESAPSHLAIFNHAIAMNRQYKQDRQFVSWHEMFVLPFGEFEYVNCHPRTGLLPYFQAIEIER